MQPSRTPLLYVSALFWAATVLALPSIKVLPSDEGEADKKGEPKVEIGLHDVAFGTGGGISAVAWDALQKRSDSTEAGRPEIRSVDDIRAHLENYEDRLDCYQCIDTEVGKRTSEDGAAVWNSYFYRTKTRSSISRKAYSDIIWNCIDTILAQKAEKEKQAAAQNPTDTAVEQPETDGTTHEMVTDNGQAIADGFNRVVPGVVGAGLLGTAVWNGVGRGGEYGAME